MPSPSDRLKCRKYKKGADIPEGETAFQFKVADLDFHSDSYQWLVVAGPKAMFKGDGTINGDGNYGFMISAIDETLTPSTDVDLFRIKIWDEDNGDTIVYDNQMDAEDDAQPTTGIGGGNIVIHKDGDKLLVAGGEADTGTGAMLTSSMLVPVVDQAIDYWVTQGADSSLLGDLDVRVANLSGVTLGIASTSANLIWIDRDAAGYGWSVATSIQPGTLDLLSTVAHELGHKLGLGHDVMERRWL